MHKMVVKDGLALLDGEDQLSSLVEVHGFPKDFVEEVIVPLIKPGDVVLDAGAALGDHTVSYLRAVGESGEVIAVEPHPEFFKCLEVNCPTAFRINGLLWNEETELFLYESPGNVGASFVVDGPVYEPIEGCLYGTIGPIKAITVDSLVLVKLNLMKLDCEGSEFRILQGAEQTLKRLKPTLICEVNSFLMSLQGGTLEDFYAFLESLGYQWKSVRGEPDRCCRMCDVLAWHKDSPSL